MITIDKVDFSRLRAYNGKTTQCFEHLCYQLAFKEYGHLGTFTAIDGSGGDGGVEFYLDLHNGERWGWQCKFFGDSGRLSVSSRDTGISNSFETALRNHGNLTKYFVCLKTDLTTESTSKKSNKFSKGEKNWFDEELTKKIPSDRSISLEFWGEARFIAFLKDPKNIGIRNFFFGELELNQEWFNKKFYENFEKVKDKYDPDLHAVDQFTQSIVDFVLFDLDYTILTTGLKDDLIKIVNEIESSINSFNSAKMLSKGEHLQRNDFYRASQEFKSLVDLAFAKISFVNDCFTNYEPEKLINFTSEDLRSASITFLDKLEQINFDEKLRASGDSQSIISNMSKFFETYGRFFRNYFHGFQQELHLIADAAKGKTHLSVDMAYKRIKREQPVLFLTGDKFTDETSITAAMQKILDIPLEFSFDDFLNALEIYGSINKVRIPLIIDGLNETVSQRLFSPIWANHLQAFINKILQRKNLVIISTCRGSYADRIWDDITKTEFHHINGFGDNQTIQEALGKYFKKYKLKADMFFAPVEKFRDPIFLKIFCEIKNPNWCSSGEILVNLEEESSYDVLNEYLIQINSRVTKNNPILKSNEIFVSTALKKLSNYLWDNNLREMSVEDFYKLIDGESNYEKDKSKADILIHEGLVISRDIRSKVEYISFTYDVLAGYMIAENLIDHHSNLSFFKSSKFIKKVFLPMGQHPLFEDVVAALCLLLPQLKNTSFHHLLTGDKLIKLSKTKVYKNLPNFLKNKFNYHLEYFDYVFDESIQSLFKLPASIVKQSDAAIVWELFSKGNENRELLYDLFFKTVAELNHPLNAVFFGKLLADLKMSERDVSWTEYVRQKSYRLEEFIDRFEMQCRNNGTESDLIKKKQKLISKILVWFLTSTNRRLRDKATRALYFYGRKITADFMSLVQESLSYNDPYIWERTLAAAYGVVMAEYNSFKQDKERNELFCGFCKSIYELIFAEQAPFGTTHILARDYASRLIELCLSHNHELLSEAERINVRPPYSFGGIRELSEFDYGKIEYGFDGPIQMDFSNYTLGRIVEGGTAYNNPEEKQKVRRQIYWRIYDLGWNKELFSDVERALGNDNYYGQSRGKQAKVERYGKKYSWIAFFENAGLRDDLGLLNRGWDSFRISEANIDPSFPEKMTNEPFFKNDLLGDRSLPLNVWYEHGGIPSLKGYLEVDNIVDNPGPWICLESYVNQEEISAERSMYTIMRSIIVSDFDYEEIVRLLNEIDFSKTHIPDRRESYYTFAGELYNTEDSTESNYVNLRFDIGSKKKIIKQDDPEFMSERRWYGLFEELELPDQIEVDEDIHKDFKVLFPVMDYNWENYHSETNIAGGTTVLAKEIVNKLGLFSKAQTFDLFDGLGNRAAFTLECFEDFNNNHGFTYIRKDQLDKYLKETKTKLISILWGEREVSFTTNERREEYFNEQPYVQDQKFHKIFEYSI